METLLLKIAQLSGATDTAHLEKAIEAVPGVASVEVESASHTVVVEHEGVEPSHLVTVAEDLGYNASFD